MVCNKTFIDTLDSVYGGLSNVPEGQPETEADPAFPAEALVAIGGVAGALLSVFIVLMILIRKGVVATMTLLDKIICMRGQQERARAPEIPPTPPPRNATDEEMVVFQMRNLAHDARDAHLYTSVSRSYV